MKCKIIAATMEVPPTLEREFAFRDAIAFAQQLECPIQFEFNSTMHLAKPATVEVMQQRCITVKQDYRPPETFGQAVAVATELDANWGPDYAGRKCTEFHWQVEHRNYQGETVSIWNIYPTTRKICIDPAYPGPCITIKKWEGLKLDDCIKAAAFACRKKAEKAIH